MHRRTLSLLALLFLVSLPVFASQFVELSFDQVASESQLIVRGTVVDTYSAWDDAHEVIYTYATVRVSRYFGETTGPDMLVVKEVGGTVDGYTMEAIGFPEVRQGEDVVLFLKAWDDSTDLRIHAYNQGKMLVRERGGRQLVVADSVHQGESHVGREGRGPSAQVDAADDLNGALSIDELSQMIDDARAGKRAGSLPQLTRD